MEYEKDYIMRMIKEMVRALAELIFGKATDVYEMPVNDQFTHGDNLYNQLITMADSGKINEAENLLYEKMKSGEKKVYETALAFYSHINDYDNEFLSEHNYSREEIKLGIQNLAKKMGCEGIADVFLQ